MHTVPELLIYGHRASFAVWKRRPQDIIRVYCTEERMSDYRDLLKLCAQEKKAYHLVTDAELRKITDSVHHEGVALLVRLQKSLQESEFFEEIRHAKTPSPLIFTDGVSNPHNLGAMSRTMAHFGARYLIGDKTELPKMSASWTRLSEGGMEFVTLVEVRSKPEFLGQLKKQGYSIIGLSSHARQSIYKTELPQKAIFVLGNEITGMSDEVTRALTQRLVIPGTGAVASLNVSVASAICLSEWARTHKSKA